MANSVFIFLLAILASILGLLFIKYRSLKTLLNKKDRDLQRSLYEMAVYKSVSHEAGYSLNMEIILESVIESLNKAVTNSAISYALVDNSTITLKIFENDYLSDEFIEGIKKKTLDELYDQLPDKNYNVISAIKKDHVGRREPSFKNKLESIILIILTINQRCAGIISVASSDKNAFTKEEQAMLFRIVDNTGETIEKIERVINTEKGKLDSFLFSLSSGAILFSIKDEVLKVSDINSAARQFLHIDDKADTANVIAHFGMHYDLIKDIQEAALQKKSTMIKDVSIYDKSFKLYLNPVFLHNSDQVIGVALTMEDITLERDIEEMRETFTSMVVHELRAPLSSIKGASSMLMDGKLKIEDADKMIRIIHDSTERMLADIGDILDISKLEAGKFTLKKSMSNINNLVKDKVLTFSFLAQERNIVLKSELDDKIPDSVFDLQRIGQVINNLLSNALKFTPDRGTITATTHLLNDKIEVSVHDTGIGVPPEKMALLFSKYGQFAGALRKEGGTGLGLYISRGIIDSHGGKIWLDSKPNQGTTALFEIPLVMKLDNPQETTQVVHQIPTAQNYPATTAEKLPPQKVVN
jgi:signal transduction histidine kinase